MGKSEVGNEKTSPGTVKRKVCFTVTRAGFGHTARSGNGELKGHCVSVAPPSPSEGTGTLRSCEVKTALKGLPNADRRSSVQPIAFAESGENFAAIMAHGAAMLKDCSMPCIPGSWSARSAIEAVYGQGSHEFSNIDYVLGLCEHSFYGCAS
jgi:hypothetical protein